MFPEMRKGVGLSLVFSNTHKLPILCIDFSHVSSMNWKFQPHNLDVLNSSNTLLDHGQPV